MNRRSPTSTSCARRMSVEPDPRREVSDSERTAGPPSRRDPSRVPEGRRRVTADVVDRWREWLPELNELCVKAKDAQRVPNALANEYSRLPPDEQAELVALFEEWALSDLPLQRSAAVSLADSQQLTSMIPALRVVRDRLEESTEVGAVHEWAKVNRVLGRLVAATEGAADFPADSTSTDIPKPGPEWRSGDVARQCRAWFASLYRRPTRWRSAPRVLRTATSSYGSMSPEERHEVEPVLSEWLLSDDHTQRITALTIASEHHVTSLIPTLTELDERLRNERGADAQSQHRWVGEVLRRLLAVAAGGPADEVHDSTDRTRRGRRDIHS